MITELCISGGSQKGLEYLGCVKYLEEIGILNIKNLKKIIGVSIGSYLCSCLLLGYSSDEILQDIMNTDIPSFVDVSVVDLAVLKGEKIRSWVKETVSKKGNPDITMLELFNKTGVEFTITTTCLEDGLIYITHKNRPNMKLCDAIICSLNLPFVFPPYVLEENGIKKTYVDGGLIDNFPVHLLGSSAVGITSEKIKEDQNNNIFLYAKSLYDIVKLHLEDLKKSNTEFIYKIVSNEKGMLNLNLSSDNKITLFMNGYNFTKNSEITKKLIVIHTYLPNHKNKYLNVLKQIKSKLL